MAATAKDLAAHASLLISEAAIVYRDANPQVQAELELAIDTLIRGKSLLYRAMHVEESTRGAA